MFSMDSSVVTSMPSNEWFEYDVTDEQGNTFTHTAESADTAAAIQSLLDMQQQQQQQGGAAPTTHKIRVAGGSSSELMHNSIDDCNLLSLLNLTKDYS